MDYINALMVLITDYLFLMLLLFVITYANKLRYQFLLFKWFAYSTREPFRYLFI